MKFVRKTQDNELAKSYENWGNLDFTDKAKTFLKSSNPLALLGTLGNVVKETLFGADVEIAKETEKAVDKGAKDLEVKGKALKERIANWDKDAESAKNAEAEAKKQEALIKQQTQARENAENRINQILQSGFRNRLQQIEQERQAWIKAGADEVAATEAAERQKSEVRKSEAEKALTSQKKLWRAYLRMGDSGEFQQYALKQQLRSMGISRKDYNSMSAEGLMGFTDAMERFRNNTWFSQLNGMTGTTANSVALSTRPPININLSFDNTVVEDMGTIDRLANRVADVIQPVIERAVNGGAEYGY